MFEVIVNTIYQIRTFDNEIEFNIKRALTYIWSAIKQEKFVFYVTCIYLVFEYNRLHVIYPVLNIIPWGSIFILFGLLLMLLDRDSKIPSLSSYFPLILFSISVLLSTVYSISPDYSLSTLSIFYVWIFVILLLTSVITTKRRMLLFIVVYFLVNLKMAQHGFRSWAGNGFGYSSWGVTGSPGWFQNSGEFSMQMAMFLPMVLAFLIVFRKKWSLGIRCIFYILIILTVGSIIACGSRGGVLGLFSVTIWYLLFFNRHIKSIVVIIISILLIYTIMPSDFKDRFSNIGKDPTSVSRLTYYTISKEVVSQNPLTGIGHNCWQLWVLQNRPELVSFSNNGSVKVEVVHNTYLEAATEVGLLGAMSYFLMLLFIYKTNHYSIKVSNKVKSDFISATAKGLNGSLIVYLANSYFMSVLYYPYIWILYALTVCVYYLSKKEEASN